eukprot:2751256-Rhodomonas_salina.1
MGEPVRTKASAWCYENLSTNATSTQHASATTASYGAPTSTTTSYASTDAWHSTRRHASNHSVQDRAGQDGEALLLPLLARRWEAPPIVDAFAREERALPSSASEEEVREAMRGGRARAGGGGGDA